LRAGSFIHRVSGLEINKPVLEGLNLTHKNLMSPGAGKIPGKTLVESAFAIFDTLRRGAPNVLPGLSPAPAVDKKLWGKFSLKGRVLNPFGKNENKKTSREKEVRKPGRPPDNTAAVKPGM
jgi:hypothetical protein